MLLDQIPIKAGRKSTAQKIIDTFERLKELLTLINVTEEDLIYEPGTLDYLIAYVAIFIN